MHIAGNAEDPAAIDSTYQFDCASRSVGTSPRPGERADAANSNDWEGNPAVPVSGNCACAIPGAQNVAGGGAALAGALTVLLAAAARRPRRNE